MVKKIKDYSNPSLEELMLIIEPRTIYIQDKKTRWGKPVPLRLRPFDVVKKELLEWVNANNFTTINQTVLGKSNPALYTKLVSWSYAVNQTMTPGRAIQEMGLEIMNNHQPLDTYQANILELFSEEFILNFFNEGRTKAQRVEYIKNSSNKLKSAYEARKFRTKENGFSIAKILDNNYSNILKQTGLLPSQILWFTPFSEDTISNLINKLYYDGEDIRSQALEQTQAGKTLLYFIRHTNNRQNIPSRGGRTSVITNGNARKRIKNGHSTEVLKYFRQRIFKDQTVLENYLLNDVGSKRELAYLSEIEFSLFMNILVKYDSNLDNFPELFGKIKTPVTFVYDPSIFYNRKLFHEKTRSADGRFNAGGESYLVELKTTDYSTSKQFFKSLAKYVDTNYWFNGEKIDNKILLIDKSINGNARKISPDWTVIRGDEFGLLYKRALDLWISKEPNLVNYSPMTSFDSLTQIHDLLHDKSHLLVRKGNRTLRKIVELTEMKLFNHLDFPRGLFNPYRVYNSEYSSSLNILGIYPEGFISYIPENTLFLDLETTGFRNSGSQIIMATLGERKGDDFNAKLYFARTPFEEKKVLEQLISKIESSDAIVTYNGSAFDIPLTEERSFVNMIKYLCNKKHIDLYKGYYKGISANEKFPRAKLKTFERIELGLDRRGDVNGSAIPEIYRNHLLGEDDDTMMHVISHNFLDVFTMPFVYLHSLGHRFDTKPVEANIENFKHLFE